MGYIRQPAVALLLAARAAARLRLHLGHALLAQPLECPVAIVLVVCEQGYMQHTGGAHTLVGMRCSGRMQPRDDGAQMKKHIYMCTFAVAVLLLLELCCAGPNRRSIQLQPCGCGVYAEQLLLQVLSPTLRAQVIYATLC